jgi:hypothetical protein
MLDFLVNNRAWVIPTIGICVLSVFAFAWWARQVNRGARIAAWVGKPRLISSLWYRPPARFAEPPVVRIMNIGEKAVSVLRARLVYAGDFWLTHNDLLNAAIASGVWRVLLELPTPTNATYYDRMFFRGLHVLSHSLSTNGGMLVVVYSVEPSSAEWWVPLKNTEPRFYSIPSSMSEHERLAFAAATEIQSVPKPEDDWH